MMNVDFWDVPTNNLFNWYTLNDIFAAVIYANLSIFVEESSMIHTRNLQFIAEFDFSFFKEKYNVDSKYFQNVTLKYW